MDFGAQDFGAQARLHRPPTPDSPQTTRDSLYDATTTIDDLTQALENVSRVPSPEPPSLFFCCCGRDDCENVQAWLGMKARLESRLTLSAEVGQALLQRHEAYVRRHEGQRQDISEAEERENDNAAAAQDQLDELTKENKALEKRLTQALVNNEVTEVSNKTILQELAEAKTTISRLTTSHARSVGWDTRLSAAMKEKDDMQQERDSESQRARLAESRFAALKERTSKLQSEVRRLQNALEEKREHRLESTESILVDARSRLESLQRSVGAPSQQQPELTGVLETLVDDNETLKRDNAELQALLADAREDCRALQEEVEDQRVNPPPPRSGAGTPSHLRQHFYTGSVPSAMLGPSYNSKRSSSTERRSSRRYEPLTPETNRRPLSPTDSLTTSETKWTSFTQPQYPVSPSRASFEVEEQDADDASTVERRNHKPLFLLARSRSVQTDPWPPTPVTYPGSRSPSSTTSVYSDTLAPANNTGINHPVPSASFSALVERTTTLLQRMQSADALSLTNRLKRQQIRGADVGHLSRSTVAGIIADVGRQLRAGPQQEDELRAGRRDVRALLGVLREMFGALGEMRVLLNEVVLDPASAGRISEAVMNPGKALAHGNADGAAQGGGGGGAGWMAPLSKLFTGSPAPRGDMDRAATASPLAAPRPLPPRFVPKLRPALAASATTVNVEFSGAGVGRAMTSTFDAAPGPAAVAVSTPTPAGQGVMGIFAGAPRTRTPDPWVVIPNPKLPRQMPSLLHGAPLGRHHPNRMSRNVDAVLDGVGTPTRHAGDESGDEGPDYLGPLLERTLRRRGLSDSSIHSTFVSQQEGGDEAAAPQSAGLTRREAAWLESGSVLQALSRRVQSFRSGLSAGEKDRDGASLSGSEGGSGLGTSPPAPAAPIAIGVGASRRSSRASRQAYDSPLKTSSSVGGAGFGFFANLVPTGEAAEMASSLREQEGMMSRTYRPAGAAERDYM
ncbi:hypothetical protein C8R44DRAFT_890384 [Mycena epipterygia]|nr:hypothetical protein C8R44DRAFT_890384 [Mycena epipterygia]